MSIEKLKKALEGVEIDFSLDDLQIMPKSDFNSMIEGYKTEIEDTKVKSQKIGQEILLKELKNDIGLDFEGRKDPENLKKAYIEKFGKPESRDEDIEALRNTFSKEMEAKNLEIESIRSSFKKESDDKIILASLKDSFDSFSDKTHYSADDLVTIAKSKGEFTVVDGKVFQSKDGEVVKNELLQGISVDSFASSMMKDGGYIKKVTGGKVLGDETKGGKYSLEEFYASQESQGISVNSEQAAENLNQAIINGKIEM
jgi:hypothetical protein